MKYSKSIALSTCLVWLPFLTGCPGGGSSNNNNNNSGGNAASSLAGKTLTVTVTGGQSPFASSGSYVFTVTSGGSGSGSYSLQGSGAEQSNIGTYTYTVTGANTASLVETEQSGTLVNNTLTFDSPTSGTISSSSPPGGGPVDVGGSQTGTFTLN